MTTTAVAGAHASWTALGTTATVVVAEPAALDAARAAVAVEVEAIDLACSRFRADAELERLNAAGGRPTTVSPLLAEALDVALRAAAVTDGLVDPTVGGALVLAGYDRDFAALEPRTAPLRLRAARVTGWRSIAVDPTARTVTLPRGVRLDLGATAKALAADRAARAACAAADGGGVLVGLGGDIAMAGPAPADGWPVGIAEDHRDGAAAGTVVLRGGGLATSSTTVRRWGPDAHHLIDPRTGLPCDGPWRTATVAAASCVDANIATTASIVLGARAEAWLTGLGLPARLVARDGAVRRVGTWPAEGPC